MDSRHGKNRPKTAECVRCGAEIDLLALTPAGQFKRVDTKTCDTCKRAKSLRHKVSAMEVAKAHGTDCGICGEPVDMALKFPDPRSKSIDHVIPYAHGGTHDMGNLRVAHLRCNHVKSDRISYRAG
jgi:5-methylcytosine-specific restriction endonuclease McrA